MFLCNQGRSVTPNSHQISVGHKTVNKKKIPRQSSSLLLRARDIKS